MAQFGRPISDLQNTDITGGFGAIDEISASDADFLYSTDSVNTIYECGLTSTLNDPVTGASHTFRYRIAEIDGGVLGDGAGSTASVIVSLYEGATLIGSDVSRNGTNTWIPYSYTLTAGQANNITDYTNLRLLFNITGGGGSPANRRGIGVSWAELEIPDVPVFTYNEVVTLSAGSETATSSIGNFNNTLTLSGDSDIIIAGGREILESITLSGGGELITSYLLTIDRSVILSTDNTFTNTSISDFLGAVTLQSDNSVSDSSLGELLNTSTLSSDISLGTEGSQIFDKITTLTLDSTIDVAGLVSKTYNENVELNSLVNLQTLLRKTDKLTLIGLGKITGIGKITGL